jgi:hypothetical protein
VRDYERATHAIFRRTERLLEAAKRAAECFQIDGEQLGLAGAQQRVNALRSATEVRALAYAEMTRAIEGTDLFAVAQQDELPALVLADFAEEHGADTSAARAAFAS